MNRHIKILRLECIRHFAKLLQIVLSVRLLEPKRLRRLAHLRGNASWTTPITFGNLRKWRHQTERVIAIITTIAEQHLLFGVTALAILTDVLSKLEKNKKKTLDNKIIQRLNGDLQDHSQIDSQ